MQMDLSLITTFLDLASTGSFSKTAKRIHITQSAASARIKALEDSLECRLFTRERNGAKLTDAGQQFLSYAIGINRLWQQGRHDVAIRAKGVERIGIGVHLCVWRRNALQWMQAMRQHDTGLWLRLETDYSEKLIELVSDGILDLAVAYIPQALPGLKVEELFEDELILVSSVPCSFSPKLSAGYVYVDWSYGYRQKHAEAFSKLFAFSNRDWQSRSRTRIYQGKWRLGAADLQHPVRQPAARPEPEWFDGADLGNTDDRIERRHRLELPGQGQRHAELQQLPELLDQDRGADHIHEQPDGFPARSAFPMPRTSSPAGPAAVHLQHHSRQLAARHHPQRRWRLLGHTNDGRDVQYTETAVDSVGASGSKADTITVVGNPTFSFN